jgi:S-adenosylmethionine hydrolase
MSAPAPIVTLLTDFGLDDGTAAVMKGVILGIAPQARLVDVSHGIGPQDVRAAAFVLGRTAAYFPDGTIHLAVVDPGVGTRRRPMAARVGPHFFIGPDNGLVTRLIERAEGLGQGTAFFRLDRPERWLPKVSDVFHGRDLFAPVAAHLANGVALHDLGTPFQDPVRLNPSAPMPIAGGVRGEVEYVDHFGTLRTNIRREHCAGGDPTSVRLGGVEIDGLVRTFGERSAGALIAFWGSGDELCVAEVNGSGAARLRIAAGAPVEVELG